MHGDRRAQKFCMKKIILSFFLPLFFFAAIAQDKEAAHKLVVKNATTTGMSKDDIAGFFVSDTYSQDGITMVYANQEYRGIPVLNQIYVMSFRGEKLLSTAGGFIQNMPSVTENASANPTISAAKAVEASFVHENLAIPAGLSATKIAANKYDFGKVAGVTENVKATLLWVPVPLTGQVKLAWQVEVVPVKSEDYKLIHIDAVTGAFISEFNLTVYEQYNKNEIPGMIKRPVTTTSSASAVGITPTGAQQTQSPTLVGTANYLVIPYPVEAPSFGAAATRTNPWANAPGNASTLGWHNDGTSDYIISRGNNVWATEDRAAANQNTGLPATSTTSPDPLNFIFPPNYNTDPTTPAFQQFAITNLFYWNNVIHDMSYQYGFTEVTGNFQKSNLGRGGNQNDDVIALAQSGAGTNNANFSTPADGGRGRMRMYLFDPRSTTTLTVNTPATIAGTIEVPESGFSTANKLGNVGPVTAQAVYFNDATGGLHEACTGAPSNSITGKIAIIDRGSCGFTIKVLEAQSAGAVAVIMVNNAPGDPIVMGGTDNTITIPAVMVSQSYGATLIAQLANNLNITLAGTLPQNRDGDLDNGIIAHEYGHGISNRFTGGPSQAGCLQNVEQGGEGWSDYIGLMMTTNWASATLNDGVIGRGVGTYAVGQPTTGLGIRLNKYSTDMSINPLTYANMGVAPIGVQVHNIGEIWCMAIWEMTWAIIQQQGTIDPNLYNYTNTTQGGNSIAYKLVFEGMKLQPCQPGYIDARNAILAADRNLYNGTHACSIWTAFAKRGMGFGSSQGLSTSGTDQTSTTVIPPAPTVTTQPADQTVAPGATATLTASAGSDPNLIYQWQVSTDGGTTWTDIIGQITNTLNIPNVTVAGNKYRARVFYACAITLTSVATVNLTGAPTLPVITAQPQNVSVCAGSNATFSVTATGSNLTYAWQVSTDGGTTFTNITPAQTASTLTLTGVTVAMNNNQYRVVVTNTAGSVTSSAATLTVTAASTVNITNQPQNVTACSGTNATFSVTATGSGITYKWQVSTDGGTTFTDITPAATGPSYTITGVTVAMNNNRYRVVLTGGCPSTVQNSTAAILTVNESVITISSQPASVSVCNGSTATFSVTATGGTITYQWQLSTDGGATFTNITGATGSSYTTPPTTLAMDGYRYRAVLVNTCNPAGVNSSAATLTVGSGITITGQPANVSTCAGTNATFTLVATGTGLSYKWQVSTNGGTTFTDITPAQTGTSLTLSNVTVAMNNNQYRAIVSSSCSSVTSNAATLNVNTPVTINTQPTDKSICVGQSTSFSVTATGSTITYQWQISVNGGTFVPLTNTPPYSGVNTNTLTITNATISMNGNRYRVFADGTPCGGSTSNAVTLTVNQAPSVVLTLASFANITPYIRTELSTTVSPRAPYSYKWYRNGVLIPSLTASNIPLTVNDFGTYYVDVTSEQGCTTRSNSVTLADSVSNTVFIFPNPSNGKFKVSYYSATPTAVRNITIYDSKGSLVYNQKFTTSGAYGIMDVEMPAVTGSGVFFVIIRDESGKRLATGKVVVQGR